MNTARITGTCPANKMTDKAIRITVDYIDGEALRADTVWLPRSICTDLEVKRVTEDDGAIVTEVRATVPMWWVRKLDTRAAWQKAGRSAPPMAQRPW
jgi:hypothetical protein